MSGECIAFDSIIMIAEVTFDSRHLISEVVVNSWREGFPDHVPKSSCVLISTSDYSTC